MLTVGYLGPEHTNTHVAALKRFGRRARYVHAPTVEDVFRLVERRQADYGVVPIENSLEGAVTHTLDRFIDFVDTPVKIQGELEQRIRHCLITHAGIDLSELLVVYSHPQALAQCRLWLDRHIPQAKREETNSTAEAVERLQMQEKRWSVGHLEPIAVQPSQRAAIGRAELARQRLPPERKLTAVPIPEARDNKTRFLIVGLGEPRKGGRNKTSILFALKDRPGALHDALVPFKRNRINLTKIESRPSKRKAWEYLFFIDLEGHGSEPQVKKALEALKRYTTALQVLGSYPVGARFHRA